MSAIQRSILAVALIVAAVMGSGTPAAAQAPTGSRPADRGIMPIPYYWWSLTVINLTTYNLAIAKSSLDASGCESNPFHANKLDGGAAFPLPPYRTVTWKGNDQTTIFCPAPHVSGYHDFLPVGMDPKWTIRLNFLGDGGWDIQQVYLTPAKGFQSTENPLGWINDVPGYNISCSYPGDYNTAYNVMTLSGTDLVVTLYTPEINRVKPSPSAMITMVVQQRWPHTQHGSDYEDSLVAPCLTFTNINKYY